MTVGTREQRSVDKKRRLLDAAELVYFADGDLGLTVRRLAAAASTTSQTIYTYFGSRDSVIDSMYARVLDDLDALLDSLERAAASATAAGGAQASPVAEMMLVYRRHALAKPAQFWMLATGISPEGTDRSEIASRRGQIIELIRRFQANPSVGDFSSDSPHLLLAAVNGLIEAEIHELIDECEHPEKIFSDFVAGLVRH